ncbi:MAG: hypothetical protein SGJ09_08645 [Phycisphaerae bacterium]|nr:hypothetical protein [Phycisphaerae bacterium]
MLKTALKTGVTITLTACLALGCASSGQRTASTPPSPAVVGAFDELKSLQGEWQKTGENSDNGKPTVASVFRVTSGGSAVREVMFPGGRYEMTNMYHLDGDTLMATHYCAAGNQPRMRCEPVTEHGVYVFKFSDITNLPTPETEHMADLTLTVIDHDHITQAWQSYKAGVKTEHAFFALTRMR